jgi:hypothetical protein
VGPSQGKLEFRFLYASHEMVCLIMGKYNYPSISLMEKLEYYIKIKDN